MKHPHGNHSLIGDGIIYDHTVEVFIVGGLMMINHQPTGILPFFHYDYIIPIKILFPSFSIIIYNHIIRIKIH